MEQFSDQQIKDIRVSLQKIYQEKDLSELAKLGAKVEETYNILRRHSLNSQQASILAQEIGPQIFSFKEEFKRLNKINTDSDRLDLALTKFCEPRDGKDIDDKQYRTLCQTLEAYRNGIKSENCESSMLKSLSQVLQTRKTKMLARIDKDKKAIEAAHQTWQKATREQKRQQQEEEREKLQEEHFNQTRDALLKIITTLLNPHGMDYNALQEQLERLSLKDLQAIQEMHAFFSEMRQDLINLLQQPKNVNTLQERLEAL